MKAQWIRSIECVLAVLILSSVIPLTTQDNAEKYMIVSGVIKDKSNRKKSEHVNVLISGSNTDTIIDTDRGSSLKTPESIQAKDIEVPHIDYLNTRIPLRGESLTGQTIWFSPYANLLSKILVRVRDPRSIVEEALRKIPANCSPKSSMLKGFYREIT